MKILIFALLLLFAISILGKESSRKPASDFKYYVCRHVGDAISMENWLNENCEKVAPFSISDGNVCCIYNGAGRLNNLSEQDYKSMIGQAR